MDKTVDISRHTGALEETAQRHSLPLEEVIDRILTHGLEREFEVFDWSPAPLPEGPPPLEVFVPAPAPAGGVQLQSA
jgi:hypothetical protein